MAKHKRFAAFYEAVFNKTPNRFNQIAGIATGNKYPHILKKAKLDFFHDLSLLLI